MNGVKLVFIEHHGREHAVTSEPGQTVMEAATANAVPGILADCGGSCSCGTCHAFVDPRWKSVFPAPADDEKSMLEGLLEVEDSSRLTCQLRVTPEMDGMVLRLPKSQV